MSRTERDVVVARLVRSISVPDHAPHFWDGLERRLLGVAPRRDGVVEHGDDEAMPVVSLQPPSAKPTRRRFAVAAAAALLVVAAAALAGLAGRDREPARPSTPAAAPTTRAADRPSPPGSEEAVLSFLDALGRGDLAEAASRLGPRSEAYLEATAGSVESYLRRSEEGYDAWGRTTDRETAVIEVRPGDVVVIVSGSVTVEEAPEHRHDVFPARYAQSAGAWFVEPWALDPATSTRLEVRVVGNGDEIEAVTPAAGTAWLAMGEARLREAQVGPSRRAVWRVSGAGDDDLVVVAFVNDAVFTAVAQPLLDRSDR